MKPSPAEMTPAHRRRRRGKPAPPVTGRTQSGRPPADRTQQRPARPAGSSDARPAVPPSNATFAELGVPARLLAVLADAGITSPFPIQAATLPDALAGLDILGRGRTGSGKTLGFAIPMVARLAGGHTAAGRPRGLVLVPTRELASQVRAVIEPLARAMDLTVTSIYGGTRQNPQVAALRRRVDIVVACPGRLADLIEQGHCDLGDVEISVLDEADHMADLGFLPVVRRLLAATPAHGQRMLFSATLDNAVDVLVSRFLSDPAVHSVDSPAAAPAAMVHHVLTVDPGDRVEVVATLAGGNNQSLVFTRTRSGAKRLTRQLSGAGVPAVELHGDLGQGVRQRNLASFASGATRVMVATDIAARGIHVDGIDLVIHADPPGEHKAYLHRSGRTARAGATGVVITLQTPAQVTAVRGLMRRAAVTPMHASVGPESALLQDIAGPPADRVLPTSSSRPAAGGAPSTSPRAARDARNSRSTGAASRGYRGRGGADPRPSGRPGAGQRARKGNGNKAVAR
jgi:superfamily II DNA/RNA helicase